MKKTNLYNVICGALAVYLVPLIASASTANSFANSVSLWAAVGIGAYASLTVYMHSRQLKGGVLGSVYAWFSAGMILVVLGLVSVVIPRWAEEFIIMRVHDIFFILGFGVMSIAARKLITASGIK